MSDLIQNLPTDKIPLSREENDIVEWLFPKEDIKKEEKKEIIRDKKVMTKTINKLKLFSVFIVFYILNIRRVDDIIEKTLRVKNEYVIPLVKTFLLLVIIILVNKFI
tara:strand:- start:134 stop:454 length:321 start_codon:yes stop_codon:yes gene_type:complete